MTFDDYRALMLQLISDDLELHGLDRCTPVILAPKETREIAVAQQDTQLPAYRGKTITMPTETGNSS